METWEIVLRQKQQRAVREGGGEIKESQPPVGGLRGGPAAELCWRSAADVHSSVLSSTAAAPPAPTLRGARPGAGTGARESALWDLTVQRGRETAFTAREELAPTSARGIWAQGRASAEEGEQEGRKGARHLGGDVFKPGRPFVRARG